MGTGKNQEGQSRMGTGQVWATSLGDKHLSGTRHHLSHLSGKNGDRPSLGNISRGQTSLGDTAPPLSSLGISRGHGTTSLAGNHLSGTRHHLSCWQSILVKRGGEMTAIGRRLGATITASTVGQVPCHRLCLSPFVLPPFALLAYHVPLRLSPCAFSYHVPLRLSPSTHQDQLHSLGLVPCPRTISPVRLVGQSRAGSFTIAAYAGLGLLLASKISGCCPKRHVRRSLRPQKVTRSITSLCLRKIAKSFPYASA